jgi:hypothetical protein
MVRWISVFLLGFVAVQAAEVQAGMLSDTKSQVGVSVPLGGSQSLAFVNTFDFSSSYGPSQSQITSLSLRGWLGFGSQNTALPFPKLLITAKGANPLVDLLLATPLLIDMNMPSYAANQSSINEFETGFVSLSANQSTALSGLLAASPTREISVFMYSGSSNSLFAPSFTQTLQLFPFAVVTTHYTSTMRLVAVPEPLTALSLGLGALSFGVFRSRFRRRVTS